MTAPNLTELERRVADVLQHHADVAMAATVTETQHDEFVASTKSSVRRRRIVWGAGAVAVAAGVVIALVLAGLPGLSLDSEHKLEPATGDRTPVQVATDFVDALAAYDVTRASRDVADQSGRLGLWPGGTQSLRQGMAWGQAAGFQVIPKDCFVPPDDPTAVTCSFDWHFLGSDRLGQRPKHGELAIFVRNGLIVEARNSIGWKHLGVRHVGLWERFDRWLEREHHADAAEMIVEEGNGGFAYRAPIWTPGASYALWSKYVDEWVASQR